MGLDGGSGGAWSAAFRWAHASWDNARAKIPRHGRVGRRGGSGRGPLAATPRGGKAQPIVLTRPSSGGRTPLRTASPPLPLPGARSATMPPREATCRPTRKGPACGLVAPRRSRPRPSRRALDRATPRCCGSPSPSDSGRRGGSLLPRACPSRLRNRNAGTLEPREAFQPVVLDVHVEDHDAALLTGRNCHVGRGPPPPPSFYRVRVSGRVPVTVSCQRPLGACLAGEDGYAAPGVGQGRLEQRRSRSMPALFQPSPILQCQRLFVSLSTLEYGERRRALFSRPILCRPTPIATTVLPFVVRVSPEGAMEMRIAG